MEKKYEDDELDKLIEEQFIKEAQIMEEALFSDEDFEDYDASDEEIKASYQQLVDRMKADGVFMDHTKNSAGPEDTDSNLSNATSIPLAAGAEDTVSVSNGVGKVVPMPKKKKSGISYKFAKVAGFVFVSGMCVFAASMTSEANRNYFVESMKILSGDDTRVVVDNDIENESISNDEYKVREDIEEKLNIELPRFFYRPESFDFYKYDINSFIGIVRLEYKYNDNIITLYISKEDESSASLMESLHGDTVEVIPMLDDDIEVEIKKILGKSDTEPSYAVQWNYNEVIYSLTGKIELDELEKIITKIKY